MNEDRPEADSDNDRSAAVLAADDTGMVRSEHVVVQTEIDEALESPEG